MSPPGLAHAIVTQNVSFVLGEFVLRQRLGRVVAEAGFVVSRNPDSVLAPDAAFIRQDRLASIVSTRSFVPEPPALVVEVVSPGDRVSEVTLKMRRWLAAGVELVWVIDPESRTVTVYKSPDNITVLTEKDDFTGEDTVPDFKCPVTDLFAGL